MIRNILALNSIPLWFFSFAALLAIAAGLATKKWIPSLLIGYTLIILGETLLFRTPGHTGFELTPFWSYKYPEMKWEVIANILLFIPFGFLAGKLWGWKAIALAAFLSFCIEAVQLTLHLGFFEIDDVIHNTAGASIGFLLMRLAKRLKRNRKGTNNVRKRQFNQTI